MESTRILVAYDGSPEAEEAVTMALQLAARCQGRVHLVSVAPIDRRNGGGRGALELASRCFNEFRELQRRAADVGVEMDTQILVGEPAPVIVRHARDIGADLIAIGHRPSHSWLDRLKSPTERAVLGSASCPVLLVRSDPARSQPVLGLARRLPEHEEG